MKKLLSLALAALMVLSVLTACGANNAQNADAAANDGEKVFKIGVVQLVEHNALDAACQGFIDGLDKAGIKYSIDVQNAQGEQATCATIATKFVNDKVDLILAIATPAAQAAAQATQSIPILVTAVTDPANAGLVKSNDLPGGNVSGTSDKNPIEQQMELITKFVPNAKNIGLMYCSSEDNSILQAQWAKEAASKLGLSCEDYTVADSNEIQAVAQSAVGKVDAIYIPTDNTLAAAMATVALVAQPNKIPVFCGEGNMVTEGGLATYGIDYHRLGEITAEQAVEILVNGKNIKEMPIAYSKAEDLSLVINEETAAAIGIKIPADLVK